MAEYLAPGVYVEEFDSGVQAMEGVSTSTAGFLGLAQRGPASGRPVLITSFPEFKRRFGGYLSPAEYGDFRFLAYGVEQFFANGGGSCYCLRVVPGDALPAQSPDGPMVLTARDSGTWGNEIQVVFTRSVRAKTQVVGSKEDKFQLKNPAGFREGDVVAYRVGDDQVTYRKVVSCSGDEVVFDQPLPADAVDNALVPQKVLEACGVDVLIQWGDQQERYEGCSLNPQASDYLEQALKQSQLVSLELKPEDKTADLLALLGGESGGNQVTVSLSGGTNGTVEGLDMGVFLGSDSGPGKRTGIEAFQEVSDVSILAIPGVTDASVQAKLIVHCENQGDRFAVLDAPFTCTDTGELMGHRGKYDSSYAALYAPWLQIYDPLLKKPAYFPPSASVCGIYARTDTQRGVWKAPANEVVQNCTGLAVSYHEGEQGKLNPGGVNLIRSIPGQGIRVWGAHTCSSQGNWKYVNVRRLFLFLEQSIRANTGWVVFEPNDEELWSRVRGTIQLFLETQRRRGALAGDTPEQAYYVNVGSSTMTQDDILNGRLICEIGVSPVRPAEFVVFRITQITQSGT